MHYLDLYLNAAKPEGQPCLLRGPSTMDSASSWICLMRDAVLCRLWFMQDSGIIGVTPSPVGILGDGESLLLGAKLASALGAPDFVFGQTAWTTVTDANGTHYEGALVFDSAALQAGFTSDTQLNANLLIDVRSVNADQSSRLTWQFPCICYRNAILGTEGVPLNGNPPYPTPQQLTAAFAALAPQGDIRIPDRDNNNALLRLVKKDGALQFESID